MSRPSDSTPRAFEELISENLDSLYRTALRLVGGRTSDAEDLLQDTALRAFEHFGQLRQQEAGRSWLFSILIRTNMNRLRTAARRAEQLGVDMSDTEFEEALAAWTCAPTPDKWLERAELEETLARALDALDHNLRATIVLADIEGFSQREAARMLDVPEGTVASRLFRARRELRALLSERPHLQKARGRA